MKKFVFLFILFSLLFTSGCEMPFIDSQKDITLNFIEANAQIISASSTIDENLINDLEEAKIDTYVILINDVIHAQNLQQSLYDNVKNEEAPYDNPKIKYLYLNIIDNKIKSYSELIHILKEENKDSLISFIDNHKIKSKNIKEKTLIEINHILTILKEEHIENLTDITFNKENDEENNKSPKNEK